MDYQELNIMKQDALLVVANNGNVDPEVIAEHLNISLDVSQKLCRLLIAEGLVKKNPKFNG